MWTDRDVELVLEWQDEDDDRCSGCGQPLSESVGASPRNYVTDIVTCGGCVAMKQRERVVSRDKNADTDGAYPVVRRWEEESNG